MKEGHRCYYFSHIISNNDNLAVSKIILNFQEIIMNKRILTIAPFFYRYSDTYHQFSFYSVSTIKSIKSQL